MTNDSRRSCVDSPWRNVRLCAALLFATILILRGSVPAQTTHVVSEEGRKVKIGVPPEYPDLAKRNHIKGMTRLELAIAADGSVKNIKVLGGNPVLVQASVDAVKKWKYEPASGESSALVKFEFIPDR